MRRGKRSYPVGKATRRHTIQRTPNCNEAIVLTRGFPRFSQKMQEPSGIERARIGHWLTGALHHRRIALAQLLCPFLLSPAHHVALHLGQEWPGNLQVVTGMLQRCQLRNLSDLRAAEPADAAG
jgi:hypothetical protein